MTVPYLYLYHKGFLRLQTPVVRTPLIYPVTLMFDYIFLAYFLSQILLLLRFTLLLRFPPLLRLPPLLGFPPPCTVHPPPCTVHPAPCTVHPAPCMVHPSQPAPMLVGMHALNYISIPLDYIVHVQVLRLQDCPPSCPAVPPPPPPPYTGRRGRYRPRGRRAGRGRRGRGARGCSTNVSSIFETFTKHCNN